MQNRTQNAMRRLGGESIPNCPVKIDPKILLGFDELRALFKKQCTQAHTYLNSLVLTALFQRRYHQGLTLPMLPVHHSCESNVCNDK